MTEPIRIPIISNYTLEIINDELIIKMSNIIMTNQYNIPNISNYTLKILKDEIIIISKIIHITEKEIVNRTYSFTKSTILECIITSADKTITNKLNYQSILIDIWKSMPNENFEKSQYNFKKYNERGKNGFNWREDINMSFQSKDANGAIKEYLRLNTFSTFFCRPNS